MNRITDSSGRLPAGFVGDLVQVCVVTSDYRARIEGMLRLGIGPWTVFTFSPDSCTQMMYRGQSIDQRFKVCLANAGGMNWEIIQPIHGPSIYADFLERHGDGVQHLLFSCEGRSWDEKRSGLEEAGYTCIQSGCWLGRLGYAYYSTEESIGTVVEVVDMPPDWQRPEPEETYS